MEAGEASAAEYGEAETEVAGDRRDFAEVGIGVGEAEVVGGGGGDGGGGAAAVVEVAAVAEGPDPPHHRNWDRTCASASGTSPRSPAWLFSDVVRFHDRKNTTYEVFELGLGFGLSLAIFWLSSQANVRNCHNLASLDVFKPQADTRTHNGHYFEI